MDLRKINGVSIEEVLHALRLILSEEFEKVKVTPMEFKSKRVFMSNVIMVPRPVQSKEDYIELLRKNLQGSILKGNDDDHYLVYHSLYEPISLDYVLGDYTGMVELAPERRGEKRIRAETLVRYLNEREQK